MTAAPDPQTNIAVALSELRGELRTALADIKGSLRLLVDRSDRTDADLRRLREDTEKEIDELRTELSELKKGRWPLAQIGALTTVGALLVSVIGLIVTR